MNYKTHKWKWLFGLGLFAALIGGALWWHFDDEKAPDALTEFVAPISQQNMEEAQERMAKVPRTLSRYASLKAKVRQRVNLLGCEMIGTGDYLQGDPKRRQTRFIFRLQFEEAVLSWRQYCDGRSLWSAKKGLDGRTKVARVDLKDLQDDEDRLELSAPVSWGAGGLPQFMSSLDDAFIFTRIDADWLDNMPVEIVRGRWDPARLEKLVKEGLPTDGSPVDPELIPAHLPQAVSVTLGKDDQFPYRIEFLRTNELGELVPTVTMEIFEVDYRAELTDSQFEFDPGEVEIRDGTQDFLKAQNWTAEN